MVRPLVLPTYVLPLPMDACRVVASYLLHPNMIIRRYADMQRSYISERIARAMDELQENFDRYEMMDYLTAWYLLDRIRRAMWRQQKITSSIIRLTSNMGAAVTSPVDSVDAHIRELSAKSTWPIYLPELKVWIMHGWHQTFLNHTGIS